MSPTNAMTEAPTASPITNAPTLTSSPTVCSTDSYCGNEVATTYGPLICDSSNIVYKRLMNFTYVHDDQEYEMINLYGPEDPFQAAALVIAAPHGGSLKPHFMVNRTEDDTQYCPNGCRILKDSYTKEIATKIKDRVIANYCKAPYLIVNELHREKMDANRAREEATFDDPVGIEAWTKFHEFINYAQGLVQDQFGTITNDVGRVGSRGLFFDVHGYAGYDWHVDGGKFIQWGYRLSKDSLDTDPITGHCPIDEDLTDSSTRGSLTHARKLPNKSLECLVRGPRSLGQRFNEQLPITSDSLCGAGLPSFDYRDPKAIAKDTNYCTNDSDDNCHYYSGGYDVEVHERMDWENILGNHMNAAQAEFPRCIRFAASTVHDQVANKISISLCSFMHALFGPSANTC